MALKRGDPVPGDTVPTVKELAQAFIRNWCMKAVKRVKAKEAEAKAADTVEVFALRCYAEIVEPGINGLLAVDGDLAPSHLELDFSSH